MANKFYYQSKKEMAMIRAAIFDLELTQKEIAQAIKKPESTVSEVLRGRKTACPTLSLIKSYLAIKILEDRKNVN